MDARALGYCGSPCAEGGFAADRRLAALPPIAYAPMAMRSVFGPPFADFAARFWRNRLSELGKNRSATIEVRPWARRVAVATGVATVVAFGVSVAAGPVVRNAITSRSARRHIVVHAGAIELRWWAIRVHDVDVRFESMPDVQLHVSRVDAHFTWRLGISSLDLDGTRVYALATGRRLADEWHSWRTLPRHGRAEISPLGGGIVDLTLRAVDARWDDPDDPSEPRLALRAEGRALHNGLSLLIPEAYIRYGKLRGSLLDSRLEVDAAGSVRSALSRSVTIECLFAASGPADLATLSTRSTFATAALERIRDESREWVEAVAARLAPGSQVAAEGLTWKLSREGDAVALTVGPGPAQLARSESELAGRFSAEAPAPSTPLALTFAAPIGHSGDFSVALQGGPVTLSALGIQEGALGLVDVNNASVAGRANAVLAREGASLTFDVDGLGRRLAMRSSRLSSDVVRAPDLDFRLRGSLRAGGELRVDDFGLRVGALDMTANGTLARGTEALQGEVRFRLKPAPCQALLDSVPLALFPDLAGTDLSGSYGLFGRVAFDSDHLDDLALNYTADDRCKFVDVPPWLSREQFETAFVHRIVLPDGTYGEMMTGPGTSNWTPLDQISPYLQVAVLTTEDGGFFRHRGFNRSSIRSSLIANIKAGRFVRGASTITMQLAKNLFLSRNKTVSRKLEEVVLTEYLEQAFEKDELMELYLNVIEFGPAIYGVTAAADHYFGRSPDQLTLSESLFLATLLPSPRRLSSVRDRGSLPEPWLRSLRTLMRAAHKAGRITDSELAAGEAEDVVFWAGGVRPAPRGPIAPRPRLEGEDDETSGASPLRDGL